jgi:hypothetical protein
MVSADEMRSPVVTAFFKRKLNLQNEMRGFVYGAAATHPCVTAFWAVLIFGSLKRWVS